MTEMIRTFALVAIDEFDREIDRFDLQFAESPKNLGFEMIFTTVESHLTTYFTSATQKKLPTTLNLNFVPPLAYEKLNSFKRFVKRYMNSRMLFEYNDTTEIKYWEGKVESLGVEELQDWGGFVCPMSFLPATPKFVKKDNIISVVRSNIGKSYSFKYPYCYGESVFQNNEIDNTYFDDIPLRITLYGSMSAPQISLQDEESKEVYSSVRFTNLFLREGEHLILDSAQAKALLFRNGSYVSAYDYIDKTASLDSFLFARSNKKSRILITLDPKETGYLQASYRVYTI